jgi:hypothetical protein
LVWLLRLSEKGTFSCLCVKLGVGRPRSTDGARGKASEPRPRSVTQGGETFSPRIDL